MQNQRYKFSNAMTSEEDVYTIRPRPSGAFCRAEIAPAPSRATFESVINRNQMCAKFRTLPKCAQFLGRYLINSNCSK